MAEITLADVLAQIQVLIVNSEQVNSRLGKIEEHLAGVTSETPPPADDDAEFWKQFMAAPLPDPDTFKPEAFTVYERGRVLYQWLAQYTPKGARIYTPVDKYMTLIRAMYADPLHPVSQAFQVEGISFESAVYAILSGRVDDAAATPTLASRWYGQVVALGKHDAQWMFDKDIAEAGQGGTPSGN